MQAIGNGNLKRLKELVDVMKQIADSELSIKGSCLNVCSLQSAVPHCKREPVVFYTTLLAYAAVMNEKEMVKFLIHAGTGTYISCTGYYFIF